MMSPEQFAEMYKTVGAIDERTAHMADTLKGLASKESVDALGLRVSNLEDGRKWVNRLSITAIVGVIVTFVKSHTGWS
jgi:hypothetical protein